MIKANDQVRFVNFEQEDRPSVREFMEENRKRTFTVDSVWSESEHLIFLMGIKNYFQEQCLAKQRFKVGDKVRISSSKTPYVVTGISSRVTGGSTHYIVRVVSGSWEKVVSEYDLAFFEAAPNDTNSYYGRMAESFEEWSRLRLGIVKDAESTLTQVDVRDGERLVAILYLRPGEVMTVAPMLTESFDNVSFRRVDEPPF